MNLIRRFFAETPFRNKMIGRFLSFISGVLTSIEGVLLVYEVKTPDWVHQTIVACAVVSAILAGYHGQKVVKKKKDLDNTDNQLYI